MRNLHKAYYKDYFDKVTFDPESGKPKKEGIDNSIFTSKMPFPSIPDSIDNLHHFELKVSYPGLVTGVGINHEAGVEGEYKLGMHFDYTRGLPVVYGSSVKGVLREYFNDVYDNKTLSRKMSDDIFEGGCEGHKKNMYQRDVFFDAVIVGADPKGRILCSDSITPHSSPLKNPIPLTFLKIAPGCKLQFRFKLVDSCIDGISLSAEDKLTLFKTILLTYGIGAKTNVGYGQFEECTK